MSGRDAIKVNVKRRLSEAKIYVSDITGNDDKKKVKVTATRVISCHINVCKVLLKAPSPLQWQIPRAFETCITFPVKLNKA